MANVTQFELLKKSAVTQIQSDLEQAVQEDRLLAQQAATNAGQSATAAGQSATAAANTLTSFEKSYLGIKASDPSTDNAGQPLVDGAIYKNPNGLRVYDLATGTWSWVTPQGDYLLV